MYPNSLFTVFTVLILELLGVIDYMYPNSLLTVFTVLILELLGVIHVPQFTVHSVHCIDIRATRCDTCTPIHCSQCSLH